MLNRIKRALERAYYKKTLPPTAYRVRAEGLTYLSFPKLTSLARLTGDLKARGVEGAFVEFGVALGGSAIYLASELDRGRVFRGYDVFEMIPPPSERDDEKSKERYRVISSGNAVGMKGGKYYGYVDNLYDVVCKSFERFGVRVDGERVSLKKGLFEDTLPADRGKPVALAHIDCDWHDPVELCLRETHSVLASGGYIVLDDYNDYGGCRTATDAFLAKTPGYRVLYAAPHAVLQKA